jgi:hypothetical protein
MGILLFWVACLSALASSHTILRVSAPPPLQTFVIGLPHQKAAWEMPPSLRICKNSGIDYFRVTQASRYWEKLGYRFDSIYVDSSPACSSPRYGEIIITLPDGTLDPRHMAATKIYTHTKSGFIVKAKIFITPRNARKQRVLEHEIGHAFGWSHYNQKFHMMNSNWFLGGYDSKGLHK